MKPNELDKPSSSKTVRDMSSEEMNRLIKAIYDTVYGPFDVCEPGIKPIFYTEVKSTPKDNALCLQLGVSGIYRISDILVVIYEMSNSDLLERLSKCYIDISEYNICSGEIVGYNVVKNITIFNVPYSDYFHENNLVNGYLDEVIELIRKSTGYPVFDMNDGDITHISDVERYLKEETLYGKIFDGEFNVPVKQIVSKPVILDITKIISLTLGINNPENFTVTTNYDSDKDIFNYTGSTSLEMFKNHNSDKTIGIETICKALQIDFMVVKIMNLWRTNVRIERDLLRWRR